MLFPFYALGASIKQQILIKIMLNVNRILCCSSTANRLHVECNLFCSWVMFYVTQLTRQRIIFCSLNQEHSTTLEPYHWSCVSLFFSLPFIRLSHGNMEIAFIVPPTCFFPLQHFKQTFVVSLLLLLFLCGESRRLLHQI